MGVSIGWSEEVLKVDSWRKVDKDYYYELSSSFDPDGFEGIIAWIENAIAHQAAAILERNEGLTQSRL
jgi:hypothetical protein